MRSRAPLALGILVVLLATELVPTTLATHLPDGVPPSEPPSVVLQPEPTSGVYPIDRTANETKAGLEHEVGSAYKVVADEINRNEGDLDQNLQEPLLVYQDGTGPTLAPATSPDGRTGAFGEWTMLGTNGWTNNADGAFRGEHGYTTGTLDGGKYPGGARSLLLTPEIDLRTNPAGTHASTRANSGAQSGKDAAAESCNEQLDAAPSTTAPVGNLQKPQDCPSTESIDGLAELPPLSVSTVYNQLYWSCEQARSLLPEGVAVTAILGEALDPVCAQYQALLDPASTYVSLQYQRRFNLADGADGVQVLAFTAPPTSIEDARECEPAASEFSGIDPPFCRVLVPQGGYGLDVASFAGEPANTGFSDWMVDAVDLTPYEGGSVWIGFHFASSAIVSPFYYQNPSRFVPDAGFLGFQLDDLSVRSPAAPVNVRVRPLLEPAFAPFFDHAVYDRPTLDPASPIPVSAQITNLAARRANVTVHTRILDAITRSVAAEETAGPFVLEPGEYLHARPVFAPLPAGSYSAQVCVTRNDDVTAGDPEFCQSPPALDACSDDAFAADPCALKAEQFFDLRPVTLIGTSSLQRSRDRLDLGQTTTFSMTFTNLGNTPETVQAQAHLVDLATNTFGGDDLVRPEDRSVRVIPLLPGEATTLSWEIQASRRGQFRPFIQIGEPRAFEPKYDTLPQMLRPLESQGAFTGPFVVDGALGDWVLAPVLGIRQGDARLQIANDHRYLYATLWNTPAEEVRLLIDDLDDRALGATGDIGLVSRVSGTSTTTQTLAFDAENLTWQTDATRTGVQSARTAYIGPDGLPVEGRYTFEFRIPINGTVPSGPTTAPTGTLGFVLEMCAADPAEPCETYPAAAPTTDGAGFLAPNGLLTDELAQWSAIRLASPSSLPGESASVFGPGFGIGTNPPPYLSAEFSTCPDFEGWERLDARAQPGASSDRWTCGAYPDDARTLLYKGRTTNVFGEALDGLPYAGTSRFNEPFQPATGFVPDVDDFWTPPFEVPTDSTAPTLLLGHQYSTDVTIEDQANVVNRGLPVHRIRVQHQLQAHLEQWSGSDWVSLGLLTPSQGYPGPAAVGLEPFPYTYLRTMGCTVSDTCFPHSQDNVSWWWPQGEQPLLYSSETGLPTGDTLVGGSDWRTDSLPLHVLDANGLPVSVAGTTVRVRFSMTTADAARDPSADLDWGWRIGGLAVVEGERVNRDLAVTDAQLALPYDPQALGIGPGTIVPVRLEVRNLGLMDAQGVEASIVGLDAVSGEPLCGPSVVDIAGSILAGQSRNVTLECAMAEAQGALVAFHGATSLKIEREDFLANNQQRVRGHFAVQNHSRLSVLVDASPQESGIETSRTIQIRVANLGNVPIDDVEATLNVVRVSATNVEQTGIGGRWLLSDPIPVSSTGLLLSDSVAAEPGILASRDFSIQLPSSGTYLVIASATAPGQPTTSATAPLLATEVFYREDFDHLPVLDESVMSGESVLGAPWSQMPTGSHDGSVHALAGDPLSGEMPASTAGYFVLPSIDLTTVKRATLSFRHSYNMESGFDGGRLEVSDDGGQTWTPVRPRPAPLSGLPFGYPSETLVGTAFQSDATQSFAAAYTGQSRDLPGNESGWVAAEFDLTRQPQFWVDAVLDDLNLRSPIANADAVPGGEDDEPEFTTTSWQMSEPDADQRLRYWWIDNRTYSSPQPRTGSSMWWSGSAGVVEATGLMQPVDTSLTVQVPSSGAAPLPGESLILSVWDWRAGGSEAGDEDRAGTGGQFLLDVLPTELPALDYRIVERLDSGWSRREIDITPFAGLDAELRFQYRSGPLDELRFGHVGQLDLSKLQDNRGWFVDSVDLVLRTPDGDHLLAHRDARTPTDWAVEEQGGGTAWSRVDAGVSGVPGGWHTEPVNVPGRGETSAWRFSSQDPEGYPASADSRLVTPLVDLRQYEGDEAALAFDHRFVFHGDNAPGGFGVDGGQVQYQVLDERTGEFGPWQTLTQRTNATPIALRGPAYRDSAFRTVVYENASNLESLLSTGYTSIIPVPHQNVAVGNELRLSHGADNGRPVTLGDPDFGVWTSSLSPLPRMDGVDDLPGRLFLDLDETGELNVTDFELGRGYLLRSDETTEVDGDPVLVRGRPFLNARLLPAAVQWVDMDGNGRWGGADVAIIPTSALLGGQPANRVQAGDFRLTSVSGNAAEFWTIRPDDVIVGAALMAPGTFRAICNSDGHLWDSRFQNATETLYLTPNSAECSGRLPRVMELEMGVPFPTVDGLVWAVTGQLTTDQSIWPRQDFPFATVFSGDSRVHLGRADGWDSTSWNVSALIGNQVRFGFHAWTNPSREPCGGEAEQVYFGPFGKYTGPDCDGGPLHGWTIANVRLTGKQVQGHPVQLRFHVATDESMTKGEWKIDDITIAGERYRDAIAVAPLDADRLAAPGELVDLQGTIKNLGSAGHNAIVLAVRARDADVGTDVPVSIVAPAGLGAPEPGQLPSGFTAAAGPFPLPGGGEPGSSLPLALRLTLPSSEGSLIQVDAVVLELEPDATCAPPAVCAPRYRPVLNEGGAGSPAATWTVRGQSIVDLGMAPPSAGADIMTADPVVVPVDGTVSLESLLVNSGTVEPDELRADWTLTRLERKGSAAQRWTAEVPAETFPLPSDDLEAPGRGESLPLTKEINPPEPGLYRVTVRIIAGEDVLATATAEFMAGTLDPYYAVDFGAQDAQAAGWADGSKDSDPEEIAFRQVGDQLVWGVSSAQYLDGKTYCSFEGCNPAPESDSEIPITGFEGIADGPLVDLGRVLRDEATLTLRHGHVLQPGDGAMIEARPLRWPLRANPEAAFRCITPEGDSVDAWFRLTPASATGLGATIENVPEAHVSVVLPNGQGATHIIPARRNPLGPGPAIGGLGVDDQLLSFPLTRTQPFEAACPLGSALDGLGPRSLVNYTVELRLRTGTLPGVVDSFCNPSLCPDNPREGALGFQTSAIRITSVQASVLPEVRELALIDGLAKTFIAQVTNLGPVGDTFTLRANVPAGSVARADWFSFPTGPVFIPAGESAFIPYTVNVPLEPRLPRGTYVATLLATSAFDPSYAATATLLVGLVESSLPDLSTRLSVEVEGATPEAGEEVRLFVTVDNLGQATSEDVPVTVRVIEEATGEETDIGTASLGPICPLVRCGPSGSFVTTGFGWLPERPGLYHVEARADPFGKLLQVRNADDVVLVAVNVLPPQLADIEITNLTFEGVSDDGFALAGSLVTIVANVTNAGVAPASNIAVRILAGSSALVETTIPALAAGETRQVVAAQLASPGETTIRAIAVPTAAELLTDNNEVRRVLRVRAVEFTLIPDVAVPEVAPGAVATTLLGIRNDGNAAEAVVLTLGEDLDAWGLDVAPNPVSVPSEATVYAVVALKVPANATMGTHNVSLIAAPGSLPLLRVNTTLQVNVTPFSSTPLVFVPAQSLAPGNQMLSLSVNPNRNTDSIWSVVLEEPAWGTRAIETRIPASGATVSLPVLIPNGTRPGLHALRIALFDEQGSFVGDGTGLVDVEARPHAVAKLASTLDSQAINSTAREFRLVVVFENTGNLPLIPAIEATHLLDGVRLVPTSTDLEAAPGQAIEVPVRLIVETAVTEQATGTLVVTGLLAANDAASIDVAQLALPALLGLPDLVIEDVSARPAGAATAGEPWRAFVVLANVGRTASPSTTLRGYVNGEPVNEYIVPSLAAGEKREIALTWSFSDAGDALVYLVADGSEAVPEVYEDNNGWTGTVSVLEGEGDYPGAPSASLGVVLGFLFAAAIGRRKASTRGRGK